MHFKSRCLTGAFPSRAIRMAIAPAMISLMFAHPEMDLGETTDALVRACRVMSARPTPPLSDLIAGFTHAPCAQGPVAARPGTGLRRVPVRPAFARYHGFVDTRFFPRREAGTRIKQYIPTTCECDRLA